MNPENKKSVRELFDEFNQIQEAISHKSESEKSMHDSWVQFTEKEKSIP